MFRVFIVLVFTSVAAFSQDSDAPRKSDELPAPSYFQKFDNTAFEALPELEELPGPASRQDDAEKNDTEKVDGTPFEPLPGATIDYRTKPNTVQDYYQPNQWRMELGEALHLALVNSPDIQIQHFIPEMAKMELLLANSNFDYQLEANHHWSVNQQRLASNITTFGSGSDQQRIGSYGQSAGRPDQLAISKTLRNGGSLRAAFSTGYSDLTPTGSFNTLNPTWRSNASFEYNQPLVRGRGRKITLMPVRIAQSNIVAAENDFEAAVVKLVRDVEFAYWNLAFSYQNVDVRRKSVIEAQKTYEKELEKFAIGESSRPELGEAKFSFHRHVAIYNLERSNLLEDERAFRQLLGLPGFGRSRIYVGLPDTIPEIDAEWHSSVAIMLERRPDIISKRNATRTAELQYLLAKDQCLPAINFTSQFGKSGLDDRFDQSVGRIFSDEDYSWMMGFSYSRDVHRCAAKAEVRRAYFQWSQQKAIEYQIEFGAIHALQAAYERLYQKMDRIQQLHNLRVAASERLAAYKEKFDLKELAIELYLRAQAADADAELQERLGKVELIQAMVHFEYVRGTLLDSRFIMIGSRLPKYMQVGDRDKSLFDLPSPDSDDKRPRAPEFKDMIKQISPELQKQFLEEKPKEPVDPIEYQKPQTSIPFQKPQTSF